MKSILLKLFLALVPARFYPRLIDKLSERAFQRLDNPELEIWLAQGVHVQSCASEPELVEWVKTSMKPGDVFYDIGANVGVFSLIAAKHHGGQVGVYAFEPAVNTLPLLVQNIIRNQCQDSIVPLNFPLAKDSSLATFNYHTMQAGRALHAFGDAIDFAGRPFAPVFRQMMLSISIDRLVNEFQLPAPTHIKIDVDGLEQEILGGGVNVLSSGAVKSVFMEVGQRFAEDRLQELMTRCGFELVQNFQHDNTSNRIFARRP